MAPFVGLRAAWIRQKMRVGLTEPENFFLNPTEQPIHSITASNSWAIGPRFETDGRLLLGAGFRVEGDLALSLLFTEYTKIYHTEDVASLDSLPFPGPLSVSTENRTALRPVFECLSWGWGGEDMSRQRNIT